MYRFACFVLVCFFFLKFSLVQVEDLMQSFMAKGFEK